MSTPGEQQELRVDLSRYASRILSEEDCPLFDEAVQAAKVGALRAAYVMIWLACAESLKRRFREARIRDHTAGKIVGEIEKMEGQQKSVDKLLLDKALDYGFLSDSENTILSQIYELRCLYGHPYEEAPSQEKVIDAAAAVVELVLSRQIKLRRGFGRQLLKSLLEDANYLDDYEVAVSDFAERVLLRLDEDVYAWLLDEYWKELEKLADDPSMMVFYRRGLWFSRTMLKEVGASAVFGPDEWHGRVGIYPKTLRGVCCIVDIFEHIGNSAQDSLVGSILEESSNRPPVLTHLEQLENQDALSDRQRERFNEAVRALPLSSIQASRLSTKTCYSGLIDAMKSYNWDTQNLAIDAVMSNGPNQAAELNKEQQVDLGRNILQSAEGRSRSAIKFLDSLSQNTQLWPFDVIRGIALESFINEKNEIRLKCERLKLVISAIEVLDNIERDRLISEMTALIDAGTLKYFGGRDSLQYVSSLLSHYQWAASLANILETKVSAGQANAWQSETGLLS